MIYKTEIQLRLRPSTHLLPPDQSLVDTVSVWKAGHGLCEGGRSHSLPDSGQADQELLQQSQMFDAGGRNWERRYRNKLVNTLYIKLRVCEIFSLCINVRY